jgi:hypothetical protein
LEYAPPTAAPTDPKKFDQQAEQIATKLAAKIGPLVQSWPKEAKQLLAKKLYAALNSVAPSPGV